MRNGHHPKGSETEVHRGAPSTWKAGEGSLRRAEITRGPGIKALLESDISVRAGCVEMDFALRSQEKFSSLGDHPSRSGSDTRGARCQMAIDRSPAMISWRMV